MVLRISGFVRILSTFDDPGGGEFSISRAKMP